MLTVLVYRIMVKEVYYMTKYSRITCRTFRAKALNQRKIIYSGERLFFEISVICSDIYAVYYKDRNLRGCGREGFELGGIRIGAFNSIMVTIFNSRAF